MGDRIKVLMVGPDRGVHGGISAVVNGFYDAGLDQKVNLKYIGTMREGSWIKKLLVAGFAFVRFLVSLPGADIVHVHFSSDTSFLRKSYFISAAHRAGKKIVLHQHGGDFKTFYGKELDDRGRLRVKKTLEMGDVMLVLTQSWKEFFSEIAPSQKILVFPNGVRTVGTDGNNEKRDFNKILFLGRICRDKGITELLDAVSEIHKEKSDVKLYIGGIYEDAEYKARVEECKEFVDYVGWVTGEKKDKLLSECGILALPSYYEGFPVSIIEAMVKESAVVACPVGGIPDIIESGKDGVLVPPKDTVALKNALLTLINDPMTAQKLGEKGRQKVLEKYSVEKNIENLQKIYDKLVDAK